MCADHVQEPQPGQHRSEQPVSVEDTAAADMRARDVAFRLAHLLGSLGLQPADCSEGRGHSEDSCCDEARQQGDQPGSGAAAVRRVLSPLHTAQSASQQPVPSSAPTNGRRCSQEPGLVTVSDSSADERDGAAADLGSQMPENSQAPASSLQCKVMPSSEPRAASPAGLLASNSASLAGLADGLQASVLPCCTDST